jgi:hypothetical protein
MPATSIGLTTLKFGTSAFDSAIVKSYEETIKADPIELMAGDGTFGSVVMANPQSLVNLTMISGATSAGGIGVAATFSGNTLLTGMSTVYVQSSSRTLTNDGFSETQASLQGWSNLGT